MNPVSVNDSSREHFMDVLRGFCILGIFIANLGSGFAFYEAGHVEGPWFSSLDKQVLFVHGWFIEGKFYSIFSLLFGWGIALQWSRQADRQLGKKLIRRRLSFMLLLGLAHLILVWLGDIVAFYALVGFSLLLVYDWSERKLMTWGVIFILLPILLYTLKMKFQWLNAPAGILYMTGEMLGAKISNVTDMQSYKAALQVASWWEIIELNVSGFFFRFGDLFFQSRIFKVLGLFLIGFAVGKFNYFKILSANPSRLLLIASIGLLIGIPVNYFLAEFLEDRSAYYQLKPEGLYFTITYALGVVPQALGYVAVLAWLFTFASTQKILMILAPVGKMAFTNYVMHSVIATVIFFGPGWNMMEKVGPFWWTVFAIVVYGFQIIASTLWLKAFEFGPIEWAWRSLTYGKLQKFRKQ